MSHDPLAGLLRSFNLTTMASIYADTLAQAEQHHWGYRKFLQHLCESEAEDRRQRRIARAASSFIFSGVSRSGSPAASAITSRPSALSARALRLISAVAGGFTRLSAAESSMLITGPLKTRRTREQHTKHFTFDAAFMRSARSLTHNSTYIDCSHGWTDTPPFRANSSRAFHARRCTPAMALRPGTRRRNRPQVGQPLSDPRAPRCTRPGGEQMA